MMNENTPNPMDKFQEDEALFDHQHAAKLKTDFIDQFSSNSKVVERITLGYLSVLMFGALYLWSNVVQAEGIKIQIAYASLFIVLICGTMVMKMWYWMMYVKFSLLREMKLIRWEILRGKPAEFETPRTERIGLSTKERIVWYIGMILFVIFLLLKFPVTF